MSAQHTSTRLPSVVNLDVESPSAGYLGFDRMTGANNLMYSSHTDETPYGETRPSVIAYSRSPDDGATLGGARGLFYWETAASLLIAFHDKVYKDNYGEVISAIPIGKEPVYWAEFSSTELVMTDPEGGKVILFTYNPIDGSINDSDITGSLPPDVFGSEGGLAGGVVALDRMLFIMTRSGRIYNCQIDTVATWNPLDFQTTERAVDPGIYLAKQREHIVAISSSSTEIYYNAANPEGSPLKRRNDVSFLTGAIAHNMVHTNGEKLFFIGSSRLGSYSIYLIENLSLVQVSYQGLDAWVSDTLLAYKFDFILTSGTLGEHYFLYVTSAIPDDTNHRYTPIHTAVFDYKSKLWVRFQTEVIDREGYDTSFPLMSVTERLGKDAGGQTLLFLDGTLALYALEYKGVDVYSNFGEYVTEFGGEDDPAEYWDRGYTVIANADFEWPINPHFVTEEWDGGLYPNKFVSRLAVVGRARPTISDANGRIVMSYSDDTLGTWSADRYISANNHWMYTRLGKTKRRSYYIGYEGTDHVRFEGIEMGVAGSQWA